MIATTWRRLGAIGDSIVAGVREPDLTIVSAGGNEATYRLSQT